MRTLTENTLFGKNGVKTQLWSRDVTKTTWNRFTNELNTQA